MKLIVFILTVFSCLHTTSLAQSVDEKLETFIKNETKLKGIPGLAFAVVKDNKVVQMKSYGYANLDHLVPVTNQTIFPIASMDKQLIATCIMRLYENGKLHLEDPVGNTWIPFHRPGTICKWEYLSKNFIAMYPNKFQNKKEKETESWFLYREHLSPNK